MFEVVYKDIAEKEEYINTIKKVLEQCFKEEKIENSKLYVTITLTDGENIRKINKEYRNIDKATDVLSFPMFEKEELDTDTRRKVRSFWIFASVCAFGIGIAVGHLFF